MKCCNCQKLVDEVNDVLIVIAEDEFGKNIVACVKCYREERTGKKND